MSGAILFDRDSVQHLDGLPDRVGRLKSRQLLWLDVDRGSSDEIDRVAEALDLDRETRERLKASAGKAVFRDLGRYIHVTTYAPLEHCELVPVECVVAESWVITAHDRPVPVLDDFAERASGSGQTGDLDGPTFLAALFEWVLTAYSTTFEGLEEQLEELDVQAMRGDGDTEQDIERLVELRQQIGVLRRALVAHRPALVALSQPELEALGDDVSGERFGALLRRFDVTLQEARDARESVVGSFDVLLARTGHRTSEIVKVLTLASVILLPGALIAGVMGMNFKVGLFEASWAFYVVIAVILGIAPLAIGIARRREWI